MILDEKSLRSENWKEGVPVVLCDGNTWHFPKPTIEFLINDEGTALEPVGRHTFGQTYWKLHEEWIAAEGGTETLSAMVKIAVYLLKRQYELTTSQVSSLIRFIPEDDENQEMWRTIAEVASGKAGKPTGDI